MIKTKQRGLLIVISGPSGAGKGTICEQLIHHNNNIKPSISMTTRTPRENDIPDVTYYFTTNDEFEEKIKENGFLEYAKYNENYYGTPKANIEKWLNEGYDVLLEIEIQGALQIKEKIKDALFIFILPPSMEELKKRLILRNTEDSEKILKRFKRAYTEINELPKYNYVVINDKLDTAVQQVEAILLAERLKVERIEEVFVGNQEEEIHELLSNKTFLNTIDKI